MVRVYDQPNHPQYGPARRLWVIFAGLGCLEAEYAYFQEWGINWDVHLVKLLDIGFTEVKALRRITHHMLDVVTLPSRPVYDIPDEGLPLTGVGPFITIEADGSITPTKLPRD